MNLYKHYKGGFYNFIGTATNEADCETYALYSPLGSCQTWIRPMKEFLERIMVDGKEMARFEKITHSRLYAILANEDSDLEKRIESTEKRLDDIDKWIGHRITGL